MAINTPTSLLNLAPSTTGGSSSPYMPVVAPQSQTFDNLFGGSDTNSTGSSNSNFNYAGLISPILQTVGGISGANASGNAAGAINSGINNMINQQGGVYNTIAGNFSPYTGTGAGASSALSSALGLGGGAPNYAGFENTPGLSYLTNLGNQAVNRQASAAGTLYAPQTMNAVANNTEGLANSYAFQPYIQSLMQAAGMGSQATGQVSQAGLTTGNNIGQGLVSQGAANASGILGSNSAGVQGTLGGISSLANQLLGSSNSPLNINSYLNKVFGGGTSTPSDVSEMMSALDNGTAATSANAGVGVGYDMLGNTVDTSSFAETDLSGLADQAGSWLGFSPAGGGAATAAGTGAGTGGIDTMSLANSGYASLNGIPGSLATADTSAGGGAAAGTGSLGLGLAGLGATVGVAAYGASKPGVQLNSTWYNNFGNNVAAGLSPNASVEQKLQAATALQQLPLVLAHGQGGSTGFSTVNNLNTTRLLQTLAPYGITSLDQAEQMATQLENSIPAGAMPGQGASPGGDGTTIGVGNMYGYGKSY